MSTKQQVFVSFVLAFVTMVACTLGALLLETKIDANENWFMESDAIYMDGGE